MGLAIAAALPDTQNKKSPLPGGGGSGLDFEYDAGGGAPHSASASHLGGVDGRHLRNYQLPNDSAIAKDA
ncbi:hypothetical protein [Mesorhizobium sp.]|uniref:hypothetical protein n=1 Tax=Mesorhizobium sp. TaxID=1871066 RepID=UPI002579C473|nr:hypothetical protein [Mesorhizobium sp.]